MTPVRLTVTVLPLMTGLPETLPVPEVTEALLTCYRIGEGNDHLVIGPGALSIPALDSRMCRSMADGTSKSPAPPWVLRETAPEGSWGRGADWYRVSARNVLRRKNVAEVLCEETAGALHA